MSKRSISSTSNLIRSHLLAPRSRLYLQFYNYPNSFTSSTSSSLTPNLRSRAYTTTSFLHSTDTWSGRPPSENAGTDKPTETHNVQHDASQKSKVEKVKGESDSAGLNEQASGEGKKEKEKVKSEFPEGAKRTVIGMEDERGGKGR